MRQADEGQRDERSGRRIIPRPRLLKLLDETDAQTILIVAPAGYGKTTLARQWVSAQEGCAWHSATAASRDVVVIARAIAKSALIGSKRSQARFDGFVSTVKNPVRGFQLIADELADLVSASSLRLLVIDDYHILVDSVAEHVVDFLRRNTRLRIVIASRQRPSWALARTMIYGEAYELKSDELLMNVEESHQLFDPATSVEATRLLIDSARGWPAVLGLAALTRTVPPAQTPANLYEFFADELWKSAEPSLRDALTTLALLPILDDQLIQGSFGNATGEILEAAERLGAISRTEPNESYELHPLFRDFLIEKLRQHRDVEIRIKSAVDLAIKHRSWDMALALAGRFHWLDLAADVYTTVYVPLLRSGRVATLVEFARRSRELGASFFALDLIEADLALRDGENARAEQIALRVARRLGPSHPLTSHAHTVAGHAAFAQWNSPRAKRHFAEAERTALNDDDLGESIWGTALTAMYGVEGHPEEAAAVLETRRDRSSLDFVRYATTSVARALRASTGLHELAEMEDALSIARRLEDPSARTSFMMCYAYVKGLRAHYGVALEIAGEILSDARAFGLGFVVPHADWEMAFAYLGLRRFYECEKHLHRVETYAASTDDLHHVLKFSVPAGATMHCDRSWRKGAVRSGICS